MKANATRWLPVSWSAIGVAACLILGPAVVKGQALLYEQDFTTANSANQPVSIVGWNSYVGTTATDTSSVTPAGTSYVGIATASPAVYLAFSNNSSPQTVFAAVTTGLSLANPATISWNMNANAATQSVRILIQVGGNWYASNTAFAPTDIGAGTDLATGTPSQIGFSTSFTTTASAWRSFTLTPGGALTLGSVLTSNLSSSTITGIGFYEAATGAGTLRADTLQVFAAPEPRAAALLGGGAAFAASVAACRILRRRAASA